MNEAASPDPPRLDESNHCVWRGDRRIDLAPKPFQVLRCLMQQPDQMVSKAELLETVWPETHVTDAVLTVVIGQLREVLGDDARQPRYIETVHRRGYRWIGALAASPLSDVVAPGPSSAACVGRGAALAELDEAFLRARAGLRQVVFVAGDPGIGKTTLVDAFLSRVAAGHPDARIARGQCVDAYGQGEAYMPVLEALEGLCRGPDAAEVIAALRRYAPTWLVQMPGVLDESEAGELRRSLAATTSDRMIRELLRATEVLSGERSLILVLEDLHWSDHATLTLLSALAQRRESASLLVVGTYRPIDAIAQLHPLMPLVRELRTKRQCVEVAIEGLAGGAVDAYLDARFSPHSFPPGLGPLLWNQTAGNPLFLVNTVDEFVQREWLRRGADTWECTAELAALARSVPNGVRQIIDARLEELPEAARDLLEAASAVGASFTTQALAAALGADPDSVEVECTRLARSGQFLGEVAAANWPDGSHGTLYGFRHALYRQVLLARITPSRRQLLHVRIAERLETAFASAPAEVTGQLAGQLAAHFELGGDPSRAVPYCLQAARVAQARFAPHEAIEHLRHGLDVLSRTPSGSARESRELELQAALLTPIYATAGAGSDELCEVAARIRVLSTHGETSLELLQALGSLMGFHVTRGELAEGQNACEQGIERANGVPWGSMFATIAGGQLGLCQLLRGEPGAAVGNLEACIDLPPLVPIAPLESAIAGASDAGVARWLLGETGRGGEAVRAAWRQAEDSRHPPTMIYAAANVLRSGVMAGDVAGVAEISARIDSIAGEVRLERWNGVARIGQGWARACSGDATGIDRIAEGRGILLRFGNRVYQSFYLAMEIEALLRLEHRDEADARLSEAFEFVATTQERWCEAELHRLRGEVRAGRAARRSSGKRNAAERALVAEAEGHFRDASNIARAQGASWWELRASTSLARLLFGEGRVEEARSCLLPVCGRFDAENAGLAVTEARELLASLRS